MRSYTSSLENLSSGVPTVNSSSVAATSGHRCASAGAGEEGDGGGGLGREAAREAAAPVQRVGDGDLAFSEIEALQNQLPVII